MQCTKDDAATELTEPQLTFARKARIYLYMSHMLCAAVGSESAFGEPVLQLAPAHWHKGVLRLSEELSASACDCRES